MNTQFLEPKELFEQIGRLADQNDLSTYVVGGFVRDQLLGRPSKDIDILCVGDALAFAKQFAQLHAGSKVNYFPKFGTAMVRWKGWEVEFVGARKESYSPSSRNPDVKPGTLHDDLSRRDFTINSLAISLNKEKYGTFIDLFNGVKDLQNKIIRTPLDPQSTFRDDPLRMLRAIRFATQLDFQIIPPTLKAIKDERHRISIISKARMQSELNKIIAAPQPSVGLRLLDDTELLNLMIPALTAMKNVQRIGKQTHKNNFYHTLQVLDSVSKASHNLWLRWAALLHDIGKPSTRKFSKETGFSFHGHEYKGSKMVPKIFRDLGLPLGEPCRYVQKLIRLHGRPATLAQEGVTDTAVRRLVSDAGKEFKDLLLLCRADITTKNSEKRILFLQNYDLVEKKVEEVGLKDFIRHLQPLIDGNEIMRTFQLSPSAQVGKIKGAMKEAILQGKVENSYTSLYHYMLQIGKELGLKPINL